MIGPAHRCSSRLARGLMVLAIAGLAVAGLSAQVELVIEAGPDRVTEQPPVWFTPDKAPVDLAEDGATRCEIMAHCRIPQSRASVQIEGCRALTTIQEIRLELGVTIQVQLPVGAGAILDAHERGHSRICREVFIARAEEVSRLVVRDLQFSFQHFAEAPLCTTAELARQSQEAVDSTCTELFTSAQTRILSAIAEAQDWFDEQTDHGRRDHSRSRRATAIGQSVQAERAVQRALHNR